MLSMVYTAAMASAATHLVVDTEVFTAKASQDLWAPLVLDLSYLLDFHAVEADPGALVERDQVEVAQAPASPVAALHPDLRKLYVH